MSKKAEFDLNEGTDQPDETPVSTVTRAKAPEPPPQLVTLTTEQFQQMLSAIQGQSANNTVLADAITEGMKQVKEPIPENKVSNGISDLNPLGDLTHPRPGLKCEMWMAVIDDQDEDAIKKWYEIEARDISGWEQCALNLLQPTDQVICLMGSEVPDLRVIVTAKTHQVTGAVEKLLIAVPLRFVMKKSEHKNFIPSITSLVKQLTGYDCSRQAVDPTVDDLGWLMAEHRAKRYVGPRGAVGKAA